MASEVKNMDWLLLFAALTLVFTVGGWLGYYIGSQKGEDRK